MCGENYILFVLRFFQEEARLFVLRLLTFRFDDYKKIVRRIPAKGVRLFLCLVVWWARGVATAYINIRYILRK